MKKRTIIAWALLAGMMFTVSAPADARKKAHSNEPYSIADREAMLDRKIDTAYNDNQLTLQEADDLRSKMKKTRDKEQKMKDKNGGKLSYSDNTSLEKSLNDVSNKLHKKMLDKRVQ
jgi:hypothetical protein